MARDFVVLCLRARFHPPALEEARWSAAHGGVDWAELLAPPTYRNVFPLLHTVLQGQEWTPEAERRELRTVYYSHAAINSRLMDELSGILGRLSRAGRACLVLKGGALAETVYGNAALRPMTDLDFLVRGEEMPAIIDLLTEDGYCVDTTLDAHEGMGAAFENKVTLRKPGPPKVMVELHWTLLDSPYYQERLPLAWFWDTAQPLAAAGGGALGLGPEALLLYLSAHLALHHKSQGLLWLNDIAEVLYHYRDQLDWDLTLAKAVEYDLVLPLQQILPVVVEGWGAPAPAGILGRLAGLEPSAEETKVYNWLSAGRRPVAQRFWADLSSMPGWGGRIRYGLGSLFPSGAYLARRYRIRHPLLTPLYYPYRWWRGLHGALAGRARR
jgi:hypothetical protein